MGAAESNAGDAFHFWWAANRALAMLQPGTQLAAIALEGLNRFDDPDEAYEIVDLAEYYGGNDAVSAERVVLSQLKHSTRHPGTPWTVAALCEGRHRVGRTTGARSLASDLAATYKRFVADFGDTSADRLTIALVTNRPADELLVEAIEIASTWLGTQDQLPQRAALLKNLEDPYKGVIKRIADAVGTTLSSRAFCGFIASLDFSNASSLGHSALARAVTTNAAGLTPGSGPDSARKLFHMVRAEALPEGARGVLVAEDVLAELGLSQVDDLYPAPADFAKIDDPIPAASAVDIAAALLVACAENGGEKSRVVALGAAGAGKTTTLLQVSEHLPAGSVVVTFDSYGGGEYLDSGLERHMPDRFAMQVINELSQVCGTPLLVAPPHRESDIWRSFSRTIDAAIATLERDAVLVIAVDAADNAAIAAQQRQDRSFLPGLASLRMPERAALLFSARPHRVDLLGLRDATEVPVKPFGLDASRQHLLRSRPNASEEAEEFHERTQGNPRAQFYALHQAGAGDMDTPTFLGSCASTPNEIFADLLASAVEVGGAQTGGPKWLAAMLALARPVPIPVLASALAVDEVAVSAFAAGLEPGVVIEANRISFRDEDFETFIRDNVDGDLVISAHGDLATMFFGARSSDADAAAFVADHLDAAGRYDEVLDLVLSEIRPVGIDDGFRREQVQARRLDLAARAAVAVDDPSVAVRLASRGCETASRFDSLDRLVDQRFDLVARYADVDLFRSHALKQARNGWLAPVLLRIASAFARDPSQEAAAWAALDAADAWLRRWSSGDDEETRFWQIEPPDVAAALEARYRLGGAEELIAELRRWRLGEVLVEAAAEFAERLAYPTSTDLAATWLSDLRRAMNDANVPTVLQASFVAQLRPVVSSSTTAPVPASPEGDGVVGAESASFSHKNQWIEWVADVARDLASPAETQSGPDGEVDSEAGGAEYPWGSRRQTPWLLDLVRILASEGDIAIAGELVRRAPQVLPTRDWEFVGIDSRGFRQIQLLAFEAVASGEDLQAIDLLPESLRPPAAEVDEHGNSREDRPGDRVKDPNESDRDKWLKAVGPLIPPAVLAARAAAGSASEDEVSAWVADLLSRNAEGSTHRWFKADRAFGPCAALAIDAIAWASSPTQLVRDLISSAGQAVGSDAPSLMLLLADRVARNGLDGDVVVDVCLRAVGELEQGDHSASDRLDVLGGAAELASRFDESEGRQLFEKAVEIATGINDDAAHLLGVHVELSGRADVPDEDAPKAAHALVLAAVDIARHVSDSSYVPYADVAAAATRLDASTGLRALSRWDDQDRISISSAMRGVVVAAVQNGAISPAQAICLDHFVENDSSRLDLQLRLAELMLDRGAFGRSEARLALGRACAWLRRRVPGRDQNDLAKRLVQWATERGLIGVVPDDLREIAELQIADWSRSQIASRIRMDGEDVDAEAPEVSADSWRSLVADVESLNGGNAYGEDVRRNVSDVLVATKRSDRVAALEVLFTFSDRHSSQIIRAAADAIRVWGKPADVGAWTREALPSILSDWLGSLAWRSDTSQFVEDLRAFADDDVVRRALLSALPSSRSELSSHGWRNLTLVFGRLCPPAAASEALLGLLKDGAAVRSSRSSGSTVAAHLEAGEGSEVGPDLVAAFLWSAFGHPRRAVRWRAAHAVRDLLASPQGPERTLAASALIAFLDRRDVDPGPSGMVESGWRDPELVFYWMSAVVGLMVALERTAAERPEVLLPHLGDLVRHASSPDFPHVQVRELARRAANSVILGQPETVANKDELSAASAQLWAANRPQLCRLERGTSRASDDRRVSDTIRYQFDSMDTLPYWYTPLARVFDIPLDSVAEPAERWILNRWGFDHDDWWRDVRELRDESSYSRMGHRHGSIPPEESLHLYVEYHAMMVAAGELVDSGLPITAREWDEGDSWESWLAGHVTRAEGWTSDFATDVPNRPELFGASKTHSAGTRSPAASEGDSPGASSSQAEPTPSEFDTVLELDAEAQSVPDEGLVVYKRMNFAAAGTGSHLRVSTALATPEHAPDLQRALAAASNPMDWKLPEENEDTFEVTESDYELLGWIADREDHREGLDEHDPYAAGLTARVSLPGREFVETTSAVVGEDGLSLMTPAGATVARVDQWAESDSDVERNRSVVSGGEVLRVGREPLIEHLRRVDKVLIMEVQIDRQAEESSGEYQPPRNRIYLVDQDGTISGS